MNSACTIEDGRKKEEEIQCIVVYDHRISLCAPVLPSIRPLLESNAIVECRDKIYIDKVYITEQR
jgi:hypothetical protein